MWLLGVITATLGTYGDVFGPPGLDIHSILLPTFTTHCLDYVASCSSLCPCLSGAARDSEELPQAFLTYGTLCGHL